VLPRAYEPNLMGRAELRPVAPRIDWVEDHDAALRRADSIVIATPPATQLELAGRCLRAGRIRRMVLEKPLAPTPQLAADLLERMRHADVSYRVGFTLLRTEWHGRLRWPARGDADRVDIEWTFMAHHFAHGLSNWKRRREEGGGVLRFFGVHLLALAALHGYDGVARTSFAGESEEEPACWDATFMGPDRPPCVVHVDSRSQSAAFRIDAIANGERRALVDLADPFAGEVAPAGQDRRVAVLERLLATFGEPDEPHRAICERANRLWALAER
jgi:predicted dehydrogenase